jgi:glycosyltransferase involved in cell wall biosynthesis
VAALTLCVIAKDAADVLKDCLTSCQAVCSDMVVVVDDRTTDSTSKVARLAGARVYTHRFQDFASQKNFAVSKATHDWVLSLDADERLSPELAAQIAKTLTHPQHQAYAFPRTNYIFGKAIRHTNWDPQTDTHVWLFHKSHSHWVGAVHEHVEVSGSVGHLTAPKIHLNYVSVESYFVKLNQYTTFEASNRTFYWPLVFLYPTWKFIRHYFVYLGFLDGWHGLFLSYLQAIYGLATYVKAWEKKQSSS